MSEEKEETIKFIKSGKEKEEILSEFREYIVKQIKDAKFLNFFFGSGCSKPKVKLLSEMFKLNNDNDFFVSLRENDSNFDNEYTLLESNKPETFNLIKKVLLPTPLTPEKPLNIEEFLNLVNPLIDYTQTLARDDSSYEAVYSYLSVLKETVTKIIIKNIIKGMESEGDNHYKHLIENIIEIKELNTYNNDHEVINIFTTNYDLMIEEALESRDCKYTTGFSGEYERTFDGTDFDYRLVDDKKRFRTKWDEFGRYFRLFKLHGSLNWSKKDEKIIMSDQWKESSSINEAVIFPSANKHIESLSNPFSFLIRNFSNALSRANSLLIIIGYSFSDSHINEVIKESIGSNILVVVFINYGNVDKIKEKLGEDKYSQIILISSNLENDGVEPYKLEWINKQLMERTKNNNGKRS